ncbi:MAG TPA: sulfotransferase [Pseudonocardiaceae bacterium]|jgi:hypothetical protein|nr:sulfotransferase [Pseudonocardiaceae bacterium]
MSRDLLLVAGSGRSGTSLFVNIVGNLGFHVPRPWVATDNSNPRGFGESQWVVDRHTALLRQANVQVTDARPTAWADAARVCFDEQVNAQVHRWLQDQFSRHDQVVIKDPRLLWFLPLWNQVGSELDATVHVVTMLRHPAEVVSSKLQWYPNMPLVDANRVAGWINTMLFTERATRDHRRAFVRFEDLLEDWTQQIARISAQLDVLSLVNARARDQASADSVVDRSLYRSKATWENLDVPEGLVRLAEQVWEDLLPLAGAGDAALAPLDKHREEYVSYYRHAEHVAQSTTLAAIRQLRQGDPSKPPIAQPEPPANSLLSRVRRLIPARVRRLIPLRLKRALMELVG